MYGTSSGVFKCHNTKLLVSFLKMAKNDTKQCYGEAAQNTIFDTCCLIIKDFVS